MLNILCSFPIYLFSFAPCLPFCRVQPLVHAIFPHNLTHDELRSSFRFIPNYAAMMNCQAQPPYGPLSGRNKARESTAVQRTLREITRPFFQRSRSTQKGEPSETLLAFLPPSSRPPVIFLSPSDTSFDTGSCLDQETTLVAHQGAQIMRPLPAVWMNKA
jgi:hypothetical protein